MFAGHLLRSPWKQSVGPSSSCHVPIRYYFFFYNKLVALILRAFIYNYLPRKLEKDYCLSQIISGSWFQRIPNSFPEKRCCTSFLLWHSRPPLWFSIFHRSEAWISLSRQLKIYWGNQVFTAAGCILDCGMLVLGSWIVCSVTILGKPI